MMNKHSGTIEYVKADGKSFKMDDGKWYSVFNSASMSGATKGDFVEFNYVENGAFNNIKGSVKKGKAPADRAPTGAGVMEAGKPYTNTRGFVEKQFPVPALHPDRSIIRQNSLSHATSIVCQMTAFGDCEEAARRTIEIARMFEAYSTGDLDAGEVEEEMKKMLAKETN
jgi:hypothetical protein